MGYIVGPSHAGMCMCLPHPLQTGMDRASKWVRLAAMFPSAHGLIRILANTFPDAAQTRSVQGREVSTRSHSSAFE
jgi:hypothetical protein